LCVGAVCHRSLCVTHKCGLWSVGVSEFKLSCLRLCDTEILPSGKLTPETTNQVKLENYESYACQSHDKHIHTRTHTHNHTHTHTHTVKLPSHIHTLPHHPLTYFSCNRPRSSQSCLACPLSAL